MDRVPTFQHKSGLSAKIKEFLIKLKTDFDFTNREIAGLLGVDEGYLSRVYNGRGAGSTQLLAGLSLLIELETLKRQPKPETTEERLARVEKLLAEKNVKVTVMEIKEAEPPADNPALNENAFPHSGPSSANWAKPPKFSAKTKKKLRTFAGKWHKPPQTGNVPGEK